MNEKILKCLHDVRMAISEIDSFLELIPDDFIEYGKSQVIKRAVERNLEIIGEAVNRILKEDANFPIENANRIVGLRNQLIHGYDSISDENIWAILHNHLPKLRLEVNAMINRFPTMS